MPSRRLLGSIVGSALLLVTSLSQAQCAKDTDCKGERVCEAGKCVEAPAAATTTAPAQPSAPAQASAPADSAAGREPAPEPLSLKPRMRRHSTGMMVGGIVMLSLTPVALIVAGVAGLGKSVCRIDNSEHACDNDYDATIYGSLLTGVVLVGAGIPLLVVGAKKEPVDEAQVTATVSPWVTPSAAGVGLRVDL